MSISSTHTAWIAQPHVRPVLVSWSRHLALGVTWLTSAVIIGVGIVTVAHLIMQSIWLVLALLACVGVLGIAFWFPLLVREETQQ